MLDHYEDFDLSGHNSFAVAARCRELYRINSVQDLVEIPSGLDYLVLGGGSNILCGHFVDRPILKNEISGIRIVQETDTHIDLEVGGGMDWHDLVTYTTDRGYGGLENLTMIPGTVGAAPVQNIGAYGVEQDQLMVYLRAVDLQTRAIVTMHPQDCAFAYRDSRFKSKEKGRFFITYVCYRLTKRNHNIQISYGAIKDKLSEYSITIPTPVDVSRAVAAIRTWKLPDPNETPNAGSFFKNPVIYPQQFAELLESRSDLVYYKLSDCTYKVPAGWLIDQCGYKGKRSGAVGCYKNQALVLVNHGGATGKEVQAFSREIQAAVLDTFGIHLVPEVNFWAL